MSNIKPYKLLRKINVLYSAFFFLTILIILISSLLVNNFGALIDVDRSVSEIIKYIGLLIFLIHIPVAYIIPQKKIKKIEKDFNLSEKMMLYYKALLIRFALLASGIIIISLVFCFTADTNLVYIAAMGLVFFLIGKPNPFKISSDMELPDEEKKQLFENTTSSKDDEN